MKNSITFIAIIMLLLTGCTSNENVDTASNISDSNKTSNSYKYDINNEDNIELNTGVASYAIDGSKESLIENSDAYVTAEILDIGESFYDGAYIETLYTVKITDTNNQILNVGDNIDIAIMGGVMIQQDFLDQTDPESKLAKELSEKSYETLQTATIEQSGDGSELLEIGGTYELPLNEADGYYQVLLNSEGITKM